MAVSQHNYRKLSVSGSAIGVKALIQELITSLQDTTYDNGNVRIPGVGSAVEIIDSGGGANDHYVRIRFVGLPIRWEAIIAGSDTAPAGTPGMGPDQVAYNPGYIVVGLCRDFNPLLGSFGQWDSAHPWGGNGEFSGYFTFANCTGGASIDSWQIFESQSSMALGLRKGVSGHVQSTLFGSFIDPTTDSLSVADTDGGTIGIATGRHDTELTPSGDVVSSTTPFGINSVFLGDNTVANTGRAYFRVFTPEGSLDQTRYKAISFVPPSYNGLNDQGDALFVGVPVSNGTYGRGNLRNIYFGPAATSGTTWEEGGIEVAHFLGESWNTSSEGIWLGA